eukprot:2107403-Rhodomonas_salina.1
MYFKFRNNCFRYKPNVVSFTFLLGLLNFFVVKCWSNAGQTVVSGTGQTSFLSLFAYVPTKHVVQTQSREIVETPGATPE